jgi:alcohol dehydrogenase YqhD (iron-dependent ADH family)
VDIFAHAFERYFDLRRNSQIWDHMCEAVMRTILEVAPKLLDNLENYDLRSELMWAATVAHSNMVGIGGDFTSHELSHILTAQYGISHGEALAIIMPAWCKYMLDKYPKKFSTFGKTLWVAENGKVAIERLVSFIESLGLPADLKTAGITDFNPESFARLAFRHGIESLGGGLGEVKLQDVEKIFALAQG